MTEHLNKIKSTYLLIAKVILEEFPSFYCQSMLPNDFVYPYIQHFFFQWFYPFWVLPRFTSPSLTSQKNKKHFLQGNLATIDRVLTAACFSCRKHCTNCPIKKLARTWSLAIVALLPLLSLAPKSVKVDLFPLPLLFYPSKFNPSFTKHILRRSKISQHLIKYIQNLNF